MISVRYNIGMNIYIVGAPTSGKSTLARLLKQQIPRLNVISFEAVRNGFIKSQPDLAMDNRNSEARRQILPEFMVEFATWNAKLTGDNSVVEGTFASVETVASLIQDGDLLICLGYGGRDLAEVAKMAIAKSDARSYLYGKTEEEFAQHFYDLVDDDRANMEFCEKNQILYYDTSGPREEVLAKIVENAKSWLATKHGELFK